jgi:hypothetical protein
MMAGQFYTAYIIESRLYGLHKIGQRLSSGVPTYSKCFHFDLCLVNAKFI